jgi:HSP20 family protein
LHDNLTLTKNSEKRLKTSCFRVWHGICIGCFPFEISLTTQNLEALHMAYRMDPFRELWNEMNRISTEFQSAFGSRHGHSPAVSIWTDDANIYAETDIPGVDPANIDVTLSDGNLLTIKGQREIPSTEKTAWVRQERSTGAFSREVELPAFVDADKIAAKIENGVLKLSMPKSEAAKPRKITVAN